jgi:hypothetical protein
MQKENKFTPFALGKKNLMIIAIGVAVIVLGFILMTGKPSTEAAYNPDIFSFRRVVLAPGVSLAGFIVVMVGILYKKRKGE